MFPQPPGRLGKISFGEYGRHHTNWNKENVDCSISAWLCAAIIKQHFRMFSYPRRFAMWGRSSSHSKTWLRPGPKIRPPSKSESNAFKTELSKLFAPHLFGSLDSKFEDGAVKLIPLSAMKQEHPLHIFVPHRDPASHRLSVPTSLEIVVWLHSNCLIRVSIAELFLFAF